MMKKCWKIRNEAESDSAEMLIYGQISDESWLGDEVTPKQFADDLRSLGGKDITLRINSPGGDVFAAQAIYNQLSTYSGNVTTHIDGMCASAATIISCAADKVIMPDNAIFMIHNPMTTLLGCYDSSDMQQMINQLDTVKQTIVNVYNKRSTLSENKISKMMDAETWMSAQDAVNNGFVDEIDSINKVENSLKNNVFIVNSVSCDLKSFKNVDKLKAILAKKPGKEVQNMDKKEEKDTNVLDKIKNLLGMAPSEPPVVIANAANTPQWSEPTVKDAVTQERQRITDLEALSVDDNQAVKAIINAAKKSGATAETVKPFVDAVKVLPVVKPQNNAVLDQIKALISDNLNSGASAITPNTSGGIINSDAAKKKQQSDELVNMINSARGAK